LVIEGNTPYEVDIFAYIGAGDTDTQLTATLDPTSTTIDTSGKFEFSPA